MSLRQNSKRPRMLAKPNASSAVKRKVPLVRHAPISSVSSCRLADHVAVRDKFYSQLKKVGTGLPSPLSDVTSSLCRPCCSNFTAPDPTFNCWRVIEAESRYLPGLRRPEQASIGIATRLYSKVKALPLQEPS